MNLLDTVRRSILILFNYIPLVLIITLIVLGLGLGNTGMGWILAGQFIVFPIITVIHLLLGVLPKSSYSDTLVFSPMYQQEKLTTYVSTWLVQVSYFFTYIAFNAYDVHQADPVNSGSGYNIQINNRKARTAMIIGVSILLGTILIALRWYAESEGEIGFMTTINTLISVGLGCALAWAWHLLSTMITIGPGKQDIFGISQQMILTKQSDKSTICQPSNS